MDARPVDARPPVDAGLPVDARPVDARPVDAVTPPPDSAAPSVDASALPVRPTWASIDAGAPPAAPGGAEVWCKNSTWVTPHVTNSYQLSRRTRIRPAPETEVRMERDGVTGAACTIELCISADGRVESARLAKTSGYDDYDQKLLKTVRTWTYRPYLLAGTPARVSSAVAFEFTLTAE
jgi:protein TonB